MSNLQTIPFEFNGNHLNVLQINDEPWFIAKEICDVLEVSNSRQALSRLDEDEKNTVILNDGIGNPNKSIINESGLYSLVLSSRKPEAKEFKRWVTHEVLPSIRKHGAYLTPEKTEELIANPDLLIQLATNLKNERAKVNQLLNEVNYRNEIIDHQEQEIKIQAPAVKYYREVLNSDDTIPSTIIAKELGMSAITMHRILHKEYKIIFKQGDTWVPYAKFEALKLTKTKTYTYPGADGKLKTSIQTVWTHKGREFLHNLFKNRK